MIAHGGSFLRDGIPGLLAYYSDLKQFPTSEEGWRGLFVPPSDPDGKTLWKGPYLRRQDDAGDVITAAGFMASRPRSYESLDGGQAVHFTISRSGVDENAKGDTGVAFRPLASTLPKALERRIRIIKEDLLQGLMLYRSDKGKYPQSLDDLSGRMDTLANRWIEEYVPGSVVRGGLFQLGDYSYIPFPPGREDRGFCFAFYGSDLPRCATPGKIVTRDIVFCEDDEDVAVGYVGDGSGSLKIFVAQPTQNKP